MSRPHVLQRIQYHKMAILYMLTLNQWLPLPEEHFPDLANPKKDIVTLTKNNLAIKLQFQADKSKTDSPIVVFNVISSNENKGLRGRNDGRLGEKHNLSFQPLLSVKPHQLVFDLEYKHLYSTVLKYNTNIYINLKNATYQLSLKNTREEKFKAIRNAIARFTELHDRLPCFNDLVYIKNHRDIYFRTRNPSNRTIPAITHSANISGAIHNGYIYRIKQVLPNEKYHNAPPITRSLYCPLFPELHPNSTPPPSYERVSPFTDPELKKATREANKKWREAVKQMFAEL